MKESRLSVQGAWRTGLLLGLSLVIASAVGCWDSEPAPPGPDVSILLATTTSVRDTRLLDALLPDFTASSRAEVRVVAVGTGAALRMGREGNADVLLSHAPAAEQALVDEGVVRRRTPFPVGAAFSPV